MAQAKGARCEEQHQQPGSWPLSQPRRWRRGQRRLHTGRAVTAFPGRCRHRSTVFTAAIRCVALLGSPLRAPKRRPGGSRKGGTPQILHSFGQLHGTPRFVLAFVAQQTPVDPTPVGAERNRAHLRRRTGTGEGSPPLLPCIANLAQPNERRNRKAEKMITKYPNRRESANWRPSRVQVLAFMRPNGLCSGGA